ncbi:hypothetical protein SALBM311S_02871 [Streptomyces alboniger]
MELVRADVPGVFAGGRHRDLADQQPFPAVARRIPVAHGPPVPPYVVHLGLVSASRSGSAQSRGGRTSAFARMSGRVQQQIRRA